MLLSPDSVPLFLTGLYAWLSAEATADVGVRTGVDLPHYAELERAVMAAGAHMQRDLGPPRGQVVERPDPRSGPGPHRVAGFRRAFLRIDAHAGPAAAAVTAQGVGTLGW